MPQLSACLENAYVAHGLQNGPKKLGLIASDGGHKTSGDVCKSLCSGSDFVMLGGYFAGSEPCDGEWEYEWKMRSGGWQPIDPQYPDVEKRKAKFSYYGMSTHHAQQLYEDTVKDYRASEGTKITVKYKGSLDKVIQELLGGIRSCCCYIGASHIKHMAKCSQFCKVNKIHNNHNPTLGV
jgi:GMP reductase